MTWTTNVRRCHGDRVPRALWPALAATTVLLGCGGRPEPNAPEVVIVPEELRPHDDDAGMPTLSERLAEDEEPTASSTPLRSRPATGPPRQPVTPQLGFGGCLRSPLCRLEGLCSAQPDGLCIAEDDDDCSGSDACLGGRCTARDGVCVASNDEDCRKSWACKGWGRCYFDGDAACMAKDAADCRASTRCQRQGECVLRGNECAKP